MATRLNPYIGFSGNAREAMAFYQGVFGGTLTMSTYGEYGQAGTPMEDLIMHAMLEAPDGLTLMGADNMPSDGAPTQDAQGNAISISLSGHDDAQLRGYWEKLADGATVSVPFEPQMWGDTFGMCTDRFGVGWMVDIMPSGD